MLRLLHLTILAALVVAGAGITMPNCRPPGLCVPGILAECPNKLPNSPTEVCPTCCCKSSENLQFYDPQRPEPRCTAPPARYEMKFVSTWIRECQTDYYPINAHWSPPVGCSHDPSYRVWDACMQNVTDGVALVSQIGATGEIRREFGLQGDAVGDIWVGARVPQRGDKLTGVNTTTDTFVVDSAHQYVSGVTMIAPSLDRMMGVSQLRLCDGSDWIRSLKYCAELFSTATRSPRLFPRNSVQFSNCSFGYFEFTFLDYLEPPQQPFPPPESPACQRLPRQICPARLTFPGPLTCASCCCRSRNVDYYDPIGRNPECTAEGVAEYRVILRNRISTNCVNFALPDNLELSPLFATTHRPGKEIWNRCLYNPSPGVIQFATRGGTQEGGNLLLEELRNDSDIFSIQFPGPSTRRYLNGKRTKTTTIQVNAENSYTSILSKVVPVTDEFFGVSQLQLCDGDRWKESVDVCLEVFSISRGSIQNDLCNLATLSFQRKSPPPGSPPPTRPTDMPPGPPPPPRPTGLPPPGPTDMMPPGPPRNCTPNQVPLAGRLNRTSCCSQQFIIEGKVIESVSLPRGGFSVHVDVETVFYDDIGFIDVGDIVEIRLCGMPRGVTRFFRRRSYLVMGDRDCRTRELSVGPRGFFQPSSNQPLAVQRCANMIRSGVCEVPPK